MDFRQRKLPVEAAENLHRCPIDTVAPFSLMLAPVFVYLKKNKKFISVRGPLDFFLPEELVKLESYENFYLPKFVDKVLPYRKVGKSVRKILTLKPLYDEATSAALTPAPYEVSDAVLRMTSELWGFGPAIEPFFVSVFVDELCDYLPAEAMSQARDENVATYETAILASSWTVFMALQLGYCDLPYLNRLRLRVFTEVSGKSTANEPASESGEIVGQPTSETDDIILVAKNSLGSPETSVIGSRNYKDKFDRISHKFRARLRRMHNELILTDERPVSIFGKEGFTDV